MGLVIIKILDPHAFFFPKKKLGEEAQESSNLMIGVEPRIHGGGGGCGGGVMLYIHTQKMLPFCSLFFIFFRKKKLPL